MKIIKITASWCPSCLIMNQMLEDVFTSSNIDVINLDYDLDQDEVLKYNVGNILPVLIMLDDENNEIKRIVGEKSKKEILNFIKE